MMAIRDFEDYFSSVKKEYFEMKEVLAEFEQLFRDGHITEDKLKDTEDYVARVKENYDRLLYVEFLIRKRKGRKNRNDERLQEYLKSVKADEGGVVEENRENIERIETGLKEMVDDSK